MALNKEVFKVRAISAVVFAVVMLAGLLWNHWSFLLLFTIIHIGCWWEYLSLIEKIKQVQFNTYLRLGFILSGMAVMLSFCNVAYTIGGYGLKENGFLPLAISGFLILVLGILKTKYINAKAFALAALGWLYLSLTWGLMLAIRQFGMSFKGSMLFFDFGAILPIVLIASIWINDTMAYIVGSFIGKTPLSSISPKKTWEGTIGGALLCVVVMGCIAHFLLNISWPLSIGIPLIAAIVGTLGDLLESKLKRLAGVKDSGNMMPGHGGFLDRFDSLLLATSVAWVFISLVHYFYKIV
jgi:phosphatidate cytidylyltransferase